MHSRFTLLICATLLVGFVPHDGAAQTPVLNENQTHGVIREDIPTPVPAPQDNAEITYDGVSPLPTFEETKYAVLQTLDKVTARTHTVTLPIGKPAAVGPIFAEVKTCQKTPPTEQPEAAAFIQVWEAKPKSARDDGQGESQWVFSGWMFASSPALSAMDHPIYDVWIKDCTNESTPAASSSKTPSEAK